MIDKAIAMALKAHKGQVDKSGQPYILHPLRVASKFTGHHVMYAAAVLHDVVEDSEITLEEIGNKISGEVAVIVDALTRVKGEVYMDFIKRCSRNQLARIIKIEDVYDKLDPRRLIALTEDEVGRVKRYHRALKILMEAV